MVTCVHYKDFSTFINGSLYIKKEKRGKIKIEGYTERDQDVCGWKYPIYLVLYHLLLQRLHTETHIKKQAFTQKKRKNINKHAHM